MNGSEITPYRFKAGRVVRAAVRHRRVLAELVRRDVRARYVGARFGLIWSLLNPLIQIVSYGLIFGFMYRASDPASRPAFLAMLFCGLWPWWAFQEGTLRGVSALVDQASLLKKAPFPPEICVLATVCASFLLHSVGFVVFLGLLAVAGHLPWTASLPLVVVAQGLALVLAAGIALVLAPIHLVVRDTGYVVTAVLTIAFFVSPVLYAPEALPVELRFAASLNPLAVVIGLCRSAVTGAPLGAPVTFVLAAAVVVALWATSGAIYARFEGFLDEYL